MSEYSQKNTSVARVHDRRIMVLRDEPMNPDQPARCSRSVVVEGHGIAGAGCLIQPIDAGLPADDTS